MHRQQTDTRLRLVLMRLLGIIQLQDHLSAKEKRALNREKIGFALKHSSWHATNLQLLHASLEPMIINVLLDAMCFGHLPKVDNVGLIRHW